MFRCVVNTHTIYGSHEIVKLTTYVHFTYMYLSMINIYIEGQLYRSMLFSYITVYVVCFCFGCVGMGIGGAKLDMSEWVGGF